MVDPSQLTEYFELLIGAYQADANGKVPSQCFRDDWGLFEHPLMDDLRASDLLAEIFGNRDLVRQTFVPTYNPLVDQVSQWEDLRDELRYRNRFFPNSSIKLELLSSLLTFLEPEPGEIPKEWFRARIQSGDVPYVAGQMGAPPRELATHGRANPVGIPYLYLASNELTAISETRPYTGALACVASFQLRDGLSVIDLRTPKKMVSPFLLEDPSEVARMRSDIPYLERLGQELTRPVSPQSAAIDYTPSQFLCEFIKGQGYDGVVYGSSVGEGINMALFDTTAATCGIVKQFHVSRVAVNANQTA